MRKQRVALVTEGTETKKIYFRDLEEVYGEFVELSAYALEEELPPESISCDLLVTVTVVEKYRILPLLQGEPAFFHGERTILTESYNILKSLKPGTVALVSSKGRLATLDLTAFLLKCGINQIQLIPIYEDITEYPPADVIIVPGHMSGLMQFDGLPQINLLSRRISRETYRALAGTLGIDYSLIRRTVEKKTEGLFSPYHAAPSLSQLCVLENIFNMSLGAIDEGVAITDSVEKLYYTNSEFLKLLGPWTRQCKADGGQDGTLPESVCRIIFTENGFTNELCEIPELGRAFLVTQKVCFWNSERIIITIFKSAGRRPEQGSRGSGENRNFARCHFRDIIGTGPAMRETLRQAKRIAAAARPVLITGESGTGKDLLAQAMHNASARREKPFVAVNCATLAPELAATELFGYEEGTFTGARKGGMKGLFELAQGGTLFLDEAGTLSPDNQGKLLRVLQEHEIRRVGGTGAIPVDVWIMAATNDDLRQMIRDRTFRMDLYFRLNVFRLQVPPLRQRKEDIPALVRHQVEQLNLSEGLDKRVDSRVFSLLQDYAWPGNIRELLNITEYAYFMSDSVLEPERFRERLGELESDVPGLPDTSFIALTDKLQGCGSREQEERLQAEIRSILEQSRVGRRKLRQLLLERGYEVSEYRLRRFLEEWNEQQ